MARESPSPGFWDHSVQVEDHGRGIPVDYNNKEQRYNWELVFCEMYAGGKYNNDSGESYEYSLGLNGWACAPPSTPRSIWTWTSAGMAAATPSTLSGGRTWAACKRSPYAKKGTGSLIKWKPDLQVFTDIDVSLEYYLDILSARRWSTRASPST